METRRLLHNGDVRVQRSLGLLRNGPPPNRLVVQHVGVALPLKGRAVDVLCESVVYHKLKRKVVSVLGCSLCQLLVLIEGENTIEVSVFLIRYFIYTQICLTSLIVAYLFFLKHSRLYL